MREVQIHFRLYEDQGKLFISHLIPERERLESLLFKLQPTRRWGMQRDFVLMLCRELQACQLRSHFRSAVGEAMAFCMEQASVHGAMLAHVLVPGCRHAGRALL